MISNIESNRPIKLILVTLELAPEDTSTPGMCVELAKVFSARL